MNWIDFSERRPEAEPLREILHRTRQKRYFVALSSYEINANNITHWAEIEGPSENAPVMSFSAGERQTMADVIKSMAEQAKVFKSERESEKPDPFEEWWQREMPKFKWANKDVAREAWEAAMKHKEK